MWDNLDAALGRLAHAPVPAQLAALNAEPLNWLSDQQRNTGSSFRIGAFAAVAAILIGVAGSTIRSGPAEAQELLSPLGPATALAPSTLLGDVQ